MVVSRLMGPDPEISLSVSVEMHRHLTAVFADVLGEPPGGGSAEGAFVRTISTACVDPDTADLTAWESRLGSPGD